MKSRWKSKKLGDLCEFQRGLTYSKSDEVDTSGNVVLRATNIDLNTNQLNLDELKYIRNSVDVPDSKKVKEGSLIICTASGSKNHLGKVALIDKDYGYAFGGFMGLITPVAEVSARFLFYLMTSDNYKGFISELSDGANINNLKYDDLMRYEIPHPDLPEQKRIVAKLDETFAGLAKAKENAEKNLQNARALFESHLESVFTQRGPGWVEKPLGEVCDLQNGYAFKSDDYINASNTLNIRMSSIRPSGNFDPEHNQRFLPNSYAKQYAAFLLREGDLIIAMTDMAGDPKILGVPTLVGNLDGRNFLMNQRVGKLFGFSTDVRPPYLRYFLTSPSVKQFYKSKGAGGLQINISKGDILSVKIPLPNVAKQDCVVEQLDALTEETQRLARIYEQKFEAFESFKKSILHEAFSGNL